MLQPVLDWMPAVLPALAFAAFLYLPGALVLWATGLRPAWALALSPLVSTALAGLGAVVLSVAGIPWNPATFLAGAVGAAVVAGLARFAVERRRFRLPRLSLPRWSWWVAAGVAINAVVVVWLYVRPTGSANAIPFEYDTIWHFAVMRRIADTGDASSLNVGLLDGTEGSHFYPAAWHGLVVLAEQLTGAAPQVAVHGSVLTLLMVTWPVAILWLTRRLFGRTGAGALATLAFATLPAVFPIGFLTFGLLYSNLFSFALAPLALVALIAVLRRLGARRLRPDATWFGGIVAVLAIPVAFLFAQPNSLFTLLVILIPLAVVTVWQLFAPAVTGRRWPRPVALAVFAVVLVVGWVVVHDSSFLQRTVTVATWPAYQSRSQAVGEFLFLGQGTSGQLLLGALAIAGIVVAFVRRRERWFTMSYLLLCGLFVVSSALPGGPGSLRNYLVGFWYTDSTRLAAAGAIVALPFMAYATATAVETVVRRWGGRVPLARLGRAATPVLAIVLVALVVAATVVEGPLRARAASVREKSFVGEEQWLSPTEEDFLRRVASEVGTDAVVANTPFDGSGMGYSLDGIDMLFSTLPGNWMGLMTPDQATIATSLNRLADDPAVCAAVARLGVEYAIVLRQGERDVFSNNPGQFPGLAITPDTPGFEPVLQDGPLVLYRVTGCASTSAG
jgi:hypothetical protein